MPPRFEPAIENLVRQILRDGGIDTTQPNVVDLVFLHIEGNPDLRNRYDNLIVGNRYRPRTVNSQISQLTRIRTNMRPIIRRRVKPQSTLIKSYSQF